MRIMIIDDDRDWLDCCKDCLAGEHTVFAFSDPKTAINHYGFDSEFDLIIVDQTMPKKNGEGVIFDLKYINPDARIIVLSGRSFEMNLPKDFILTALTKPVSFSKLIEFAHKKNGMR